MAGAGGIARSTWGGATTGGARTGGANAGDATTGGGVTTGVAMGGVGGGATLATGADTGAAGAETAGSARRTQNTPLQTEHRARTPAAGTLAGSTRKTVWQEVQVAFMVGNLYRLPRGSSFRVCRRSTTNTEPGSVLA